MKNFTFFLLALFISILRTKAEHELSKDGGGVPNGNLWCVAKNNAEDLALQSAIDWACGQGGADCQPIQQGGACFEPDDIQYHASYAFNDYFIKRGGSGPACDFSGTAALTSLNPGHGNCLFPASSYSKNGSTTGATYGSTTGLGPSADLNSGSLLYFVRWIWFLTLLVSVYFVGFL